MSPDAHDTTDAAGPTGAGVEDAMAERTATRDRILVAALSHAAFDGWTRRTLLVAAEQAGVDRGTALRLFPGGGDGLIAWIDDWADRQMLTRMAPDALARPGIRAKVAGLVRARLEALSPHKEAVRRAVAARLLPGNLGATGEGLWRTVDRIWDAAGYPLDAEAGSARYTRRLTLAGVLVATAAVWLDDRSDGQAETWAFLERRLDDVMRFGKLTGSVRSRLTSLGIGRRARPVT